MSAHKRSAAAAVLTLTLALAGCGADESAADPASVGGSPAESATSPAPSASTGPVRAKGAKIIKGAGYSFALPKDWINLTRKMRKDQPSLDVAVGAAVQQDGFASNLAVYVTPTGAAKPDHIDDVAQQILESVKKKAPKFRIQPHATVAGLPAAHLSGMYNPGDQRYWLEQFVVVGDEQTTVISFSLPPDSGEKQRARLIDSVLKSWMIDA